MVVGVAATLLVSALPAAAGEAGATILVRVDNRMRIPTAWLQAAEKAASRAYGAIDVLLLWSNDGAIPSGVPCDRMFDVVVVSSHGIKGLSRQALGFAPLPGRAYVFGDRIAKIAVAQPDFEAVFGRVLAHELGHLLLPGQPHSHTGIMQTQVDYRSADAVGFTGEQRRPIHALLATNQIATGRSSTGNY
jgi:hypothetical protein